MYATSAVRYRAEVYLCSRQLSCLFSKVGMGSSSRWVAGVIDVIKPQRDSLCVDVHTGVEVMCVYGFVKEKEMEDISPADV